MSYLGGELFRRSQSLATRFVMEVKIKKLSWHEVQEASDADHTWFIHFIVQLVDLPMMRKQITWRINRDIFMQPLRTFIYLSILSSKFGKEFGLIF